MAVCTVERLTTELGPRGVIAKTPMEYEIHDAAPFPAALVERNLPPPGFN